MDDAAEQIIAIRFQGIQDAPKLFAEATAAILKMDQALQELQRHQGVMQAQLKTAPPQQQQQLHEQINNIQRAVEQIHKQSAAVEAQAGIQQTRKQEYDRLRPLAQPAAAENAPAGGTSTPHGSSSGGGSSSSSSGPSKPETKSPGLKSKEDKTESSPTKEVNRGLWGNMWHNLVGKEGGINTGYAIMSLGQEASQAAILTMSGNRVTPEAQARAGYSMLPGIGALGGSAFGWKGSLMGQGILSVVAGVLEAKSDREENVRKASEEIALSLGRAANASNTFSNVISSAAEKAGTPVVELAQSLSVLSRAVGGFNIVGATGLQTYLQSQLGDEYAATVPAQIKAASAPFSQNYRDMLAGKKPASASQYYAMADYYASLGDRDTADKLLSVGAALGISPGIAKYQSEIARIRTAKAQSPAGILNWPVFSALPDKWIAEDQANIDKLQKNDARATKAAAAQKAHMDKYADILENSRDRAASAQTAAVTAANRAAMAEQAGHGAAGLRAAEPAQLSSLQGARSALVAQIKALKDEIHRVGYNSPASAQAKQELIIAQQQLSTIDPQIQNVGIGIFRADISESSATYAARMSILGSRNASLTGRGVAVTDPRLIHAFAAQKGTLAERASYLRVLANDHTNSLSPEERQQYLAQAAQLTEQGLVGIPNEIFNRQQSEQAARQGLRMSRVDLGFATAMTGGGVGDVVRAQQAKLAENLKQQNEAAQDIVTLSKLGIGTYQQRLQLETQLNALQSQEVLLKQQYTEQTYQLSLGQTQGAAGAGAALAKRLMFGAGTSGLTYSASSQSLIAERGAVEQLRQRASDPTLDPKTLMQRLKDFQEAAARLDQDTVSGLGSYSESPLAMRQRQAYEGAAARMTLSPFEPGNRLGIDAALNKLDTDKLAGIAAQIRRVRGDTGLTAAQKSNVLMALESQQEQTQTGMAQRSAGFASQMFSDQISMSVNAPSFASRLLPSPADISRIAERRGLGPMSARVFGFTSRNTYDQTMMYGMAPADQDMMMYGRRPGDVNSVGSMGNFGSDAIGQAIDSASLASQMSELTAAVKTLSQHGFHVQVDVTNPDTGHTASKTVNALKHGDSRAIQRGGAANQSH